MTEYANPVNSSLGNRVPRQTLDSILGRGSRGEKRMHGLERLADILLDIDSRLDFPQSARGWCYTLENKNIIDKSDFDRAEAAINECREEAFLPLDFCAEDEARAWHGVEEPTQESVEDYFRDLLSGALNADQYYKPDWWEGERYYIQMLVEKVDLRSLFLPVCRDYHIPIANASGWSDINVRGTMAKRFLAARNKGMQPILLYCGDFDPWGLKIAETLRKNLHKISRATGYVPDDLIIDRFGLNHEFITENRLTWIDNLKTGSKKDMTKSRYCYVCKIQHRQGVKRCTNCNQKLYNQPAFVLDYIKKYGARKCEANALVTAPEQGRQLCREAIESYLGHDSISRFESKRLLPKRQLDAFKQRNYALFRELETL